MGDLLKTVVFLLISPSFRRAIRQRYPTRHVVVDAHTTKLNPPTTTPLADPAAANPSGLSLYDPSVRDSERHVAFGRQSLRQSLRSPWRRQRVSVNNVGEESSKGRGVGESSKERGVAKSSKGRGFITGHV